MSNFIVVMVVMTTLSTLGQVVPVAAQTPIPVTPSHWLVWDQEADNLTVLGAYRWFYLSDIGAPPNSMSASCNNTLTPRIFRCETPFPPLTPGMHAIVIYNVFIVDGVEITSMYSDPPLLVNMIIAPVAPRNLRIEQKRPPGAGTTQE